MYKFNPTDAYMYTQGVCGGGVYSEIEIILILELNHVIS